MEFEFDADKSHANKLKQGIDFQQARALWDDSDLIEIPARTTEEIDLYEGYRPRQKIRQR
jgi:hypothetical protein